MSSENNSSSGKTDIENKDINQDLINKDETNAVKSSEINFFRKDGGYGWLVVIASLCSHMLNDGIIYSYGVFTPEFINHFNISRSTVGWLGSILVAITLMTGPLAGYLSSKFSYRSVAVVGSIISVIGFGAPYFYSELWFLILSSSVICGIGFGLVYFPSIMILSFWFEEKRSLAVGIAVCGSGIGTFVFCSLIEYLLALFEWQLTMLIIAIILMLLIPCSFSYSLLDNTQSNNKDIIEDNNVQIKLLSNEKGEIDVEKNIEENIETFETGEKEKQTLNETSNPIYLYLELLKDPIFILFIFSNILSSIGFNAPYMFAKDRAINIGISESKGSFLISSIGIGNCIGRVGFGFLGQLESVNRFHLFNFTLILSGLVLIASWNMKNYILMISYTLIYGIMIGASVTLISVILLDIFGRKKLDATFSLCLVFQGISVLLGPPFAGWIYDITESYNMAFAMCGIFIAVSGAMMYLAFISRDFRKKNFKGIQKCLD